MSTRGGFEQAWKWFSSAKSRFAPEVTSIAKGLVSPFVNVFKKANPEEVVKSIQGHHDTLESEASNLFNHVLNEAKSRNVANIPIDKKLID